MNNINKKIAETILKYQEQEKPFDYDSSMTHKSSDGGWYSVPDFIQDWDACLNLIYVLKEDYKISIIIDDLDFVVRIMNYNSVFLGKGHSIPEALVEACSKLINK